MKNTPLFRSSHHRVPLRPFHHTFLVIKHNHDHEEIRHTAIAIQPAKIATGNSVMEVDEETIILWVTAWVLVSTAKDDETTIE